MMTLEEAKQVWATYSKVWTDISSAEREALMRETLAENVIYTAPGSTGHGIAGFKVVLENFQVQFPGAYFQAGHIIEHHDQSLNEWTMFDRGGAVLMAGRTYARFNEQGMIEHLAGFFDAIDQ
jgi:hypothetical protein